MNINTEITTISDSFKVEGTGSQELRTLAERASKHIRTGFGEIKTQMEALVEWKKGYDESNWFKRKWNASEMAEKRDEMILLTMESAKQQMDVVKFIAWLNVQMLILQKQLAQSQEQLREQSNCLQEQQTVIQQQQTALQEQQNRFEEANQKLLAGCEVIVKLRAIVLGQEKNLNSNKSGIDQLIIQLTEIYGDFKTFRNECESKIKDLTERITFCDQMQKEQQQKITVALKTQDEKISHTFHTLTEKNNTEIQTAKGIFHSAEEKFKKGMLEITAAFETFKTDLAKLESDAEERLNVNLKEGTAAIQQKNEEFQKTCEDRIASYKNRIVKLERTRTCEKAALILSIVAACIASGTLGLALFVCFK